MDMRILMSGNGKKYLVRDLTRDFHCEFGFVSKADLKKKTGIVKTNTGKELSIFEPTFIDLYRKIGRGPQIVAQKDIALIIAETGLGKKSVIVDAGAGSGALCCFLANYAKKVTSYELREDFFNVASKNKEYLGLKNLTIKNQNVYEGIDEKNVDVITLDLPEPWKVIPHAAKALKSGGFLVSYSPSVPQVSDFINEIMKSGEFAVLKTCEIIERQWEVEERKVRPKSEGIGHTGFMSFVRKV